jgi:hypothetical protein
VLAPVAPEVSFLASALVALGGDSLAALVFFGSRRTQARPDPQSAYDVVILTRDDARYYRTLHARGALRRPGRVSAASRVLAPSQVSLATPPAQAGSLRVKGSVMTLDVFERETSPRRHDHFVAARMFQATSLLYAVDDETRARVLAALTAAHRATFDWVRPSLPATFDVADYGRTLLAVSMRAEIRPEPADRARALWECQRDYLDPVYAEWLEELVATGRLTRVGPARYALVQPVGAAERWRVRRYFRRSLVRATARWAKHMVTFEGWLDYIVHKAERHTGSTITLSPRERRWPLVFLWPRLVRYLREGRVARGDLTRRPK